MPTRPTSAPRQRAAPPGHTAAPTVQGAGTASPVAGPARRQASCVLVATGGTLACLARMLPDGGPTPAGAFLVDGPPRPARPGPGIVGLPVLGSLEALKPVSARLGATLAVVCLPLDGPALIARVRDAVADAGLKERFLPPPADLLLRPPPVLVGVGAHPGAPTLATATPVDLQALIGRPLRAPDAAPLEALLAGRRVLITGAGGSIGAALARLVADHAPGRLTLVERAENALFEADRQLAARHGSPARRAVLHDVVDADATARLLADEKPDVVFHAAAHKHVPLMEDHPAQAVVNNLFGTRSVVDAALAAGAGRVVLISTDKAVRPRSVMGATKRLAEAYAIAAHERQPGPASGRPPPTALAVVRFGNVLGSAASVLRIWSAQLAEGQPLTLTDRRMTRYFMTIPEAALLVAHAAALAPGPAAGVYALDMGEPVAIADLAERFVAAHGLTPLWDRRPPAPGEAPIIEVGVRPGEKLHERLAHDAERLEPTPAAGVFRIAGEHRDMTPPDHAIAQLEPLLEGDDRAALLAALTRLAPMEGPGAPAPPPEHGGTAPMDRPPARAAG